MHGVDRAHRRRFLRRCAHELELRIAHPEHVVDVVRIGLGTDQRVPVLASRTESLGGALARRIEVRSPGDPLVLGARAPRLMAVGGVRGHGRRSLPVLPPSRAAVGRRISPTDRETAAMTATTDDGTPATATRHDRGHRRRRTTRRRSRARSRAPSGGATRRLRCRARLARRAAESGLGRSPNAAIICVAGVDCRLRPPSRRQPPGGSWTGGSPPRSLPTGAGSGTRSTRLRCPPGCARSSRARRPVAASSQRWRPRRPRARRRRRHRRRRCSSSARSASSSTTGSARPASARAANARLRVLDGRATISPSSSSASRSACAAGSGSRTTRTPKMLSTSSTWPRRRSLSGCVTVGCLSPSMARCAHPMASDEPGRSANRLISRSARSLASASCSSASSKMVSSRFDDRAVRGGQEERRLEGEPVRGDHVRRPCSAFGWAAATVG